MNRIRWKGLLSFLLIVALAAGIWLLLIDRIVERMIEKTGTRLVGASVELDAADLTLIPLGLSLTRLQVTDPDRPMRNAVEAARLAMSLDAGRLLMHKVIIEEMAVDGLRFNTVRERSGAVSAAPYSLERAVRETVAEKLKLPSMELPDAQEILEKEDLLTLKLADTLRRDIRGAQEKWEARLKVLADREKLKDYERRVKEVRDRMKGGLGGILGGVDEAVSLRNDIKQELDLVRSSRSELKDDLESFRVRIQQVSTAPREDVRRLMEKYSLTQQGMANLSRTLFGPRIGQWTEATLRWHGRLRPLLERVKAGSGEVETPQPPRGEGEDVRFVEYRPVPDFLIRNARVSVDVPAGEIAGEVRNITPDQEILGAPLIFRFSGERLQGLQAVKLFGELDHVRPGRATDRATLQISGYQVKKLVLSDSEDLPIALENAVADLELRAVLGENSLEGNLSSDFKGATFTRAQEVSGRFAKALLSLLADVRAFAMEAEISGTPDDYSVRLTSDLDRVLKYAVAKQVKEQMVLLEQDLKVLIHEKAQEQVEALNKEVRGLGGLDAQIAERLNFLDDLLKEIKVGGFKLPF